MNLGDMREQITLKGYTTVKSGTGAETRTETTIATVWAKITPVRGREAQDAGRQTPLQTYLVKIHKRTDLDTLDFVVWGTKDMQINSIEDRWQKDNDPPGLFLTMECEYGPQV